MTDSLLIHRRELDFQLFELLDAEALTRRPRHAEHSRATFAAAIDSAHAIATEHFVPHNRMSDEHEPRLEDGRVVIIPEVKAALDAQTGAGWVAATHDEALGGMQLPVVVAQACGSLFKGANVATSSYAMLTTANANVIRRFGSESQQRRYLPGLLAGRFFGTMALTEPQAGSSLSDLKTRATPRGDGTYSIRGQKIFISGGDHELSETIVHLVLARIEGAPPGVKGISLFIVPKHRVDQAGRVGERNDVTLAGLIHKMGWRGTTSTVLSFGDRGDCVGELIGEPHQGLACMFHMMNEARIGVGLGAVMLGWRGYLASLEYARNRPQGRLPGSKDPTEPQLPLIRHADIRRMLLAQKAYVEGGYGLCLYAARLVDEQKTAEDEGARREAGLLLDLLTPVVKSWPSQWCLEANSLAIQVHGGYGYTRDYPVEQFYRDNRLNPIHEGTYGIQALDLLGRKVVMQQGAALAVLARRVRETVAQALALPQLRAEAQALDAAMDEVERTLGVIGPLLREDAERALANASVFLEAFGHTIVAWNWLQQALAAQAALPRASGEDEAFYRGKLHACRWFYCWELPRTRAQHELLRSLDELTLTMAPDWF